MVYPTPPCMKEAQSLTTPPHKPVRLIAHDCAVRAGEFYPDTGTGDDTCAHTLTKNVHILEAAFPSGSNHNAQHVAHQLVTISSTSGAQSSHHPTRFFCLCFLPFSWSFCACVALRNTHWCVFVVEFQMVSLSRSSSPTPLRPAQ